MTSLTAHADPLTRTRMALFWARALAFSLESRGTREGEGAKILGYLDGFGTSANAWRITDSPPDSRGASMSMTAALLDAGLSPDQIDYINAHGTSTQQNDQSETAAIKNAFGQHADRLLVSSTKSMMGHLVATCAAVELIVALMACREQIAPPTINYQHPDPLFAISTTCQTKHVEPHQLRDEQCIWLWGVKRHVNRAREQHVNDFVISGIGIVCARGCNRLEVLEHHDEDPILGTSEDIHRSDLPLVAKVPPHFSLKGIVKKRKHIKLMARANNSRLRPPG